MNEKFIQNTCVYLKLFSVKNFNNSIWKVENQLNKTFLKEFKKKDPLKEQNLVYYWITKIS